MDRRRGRSGFQSFLKSTYDERIYVLQVDYHNTTDFCDANDAKLFETSSKQNDGIEELFATIVEDYVADVKKNPSILVQQAENKISGTGWGKKEKKKACCASR